MKVILTAVITFCLITLLFMPIVTFPDEREIKEPKIHTFTGNISEKDCQNQYGYRSHIVIGESKFRIQYEICQSVNKGSKVEVKYTEDLKVTSLSYK